MNSVTRQPDRRKKDEKYVNVVMSSTSEVTKILEEWKDLEPVDREYWLFQNLCAEGYH